MQLFLLLFALFLCWVVLPPDHDRPMRAPSRRRFSGFVHLLARRYQNYEAAIMRAARRKRSRAVDIDVQESVEGTLWGLHWPTVGRNKLHDPQGRIGKNRRIDSLNDKEIGRLRGPQGQRPHSLAYYLERAAAHHVRVEAEVKSVPQERKVRNLLARPNIAAMHRRGHLQWKTLAALGSKHDNNAAVHRLRPVHEAGGTTILSFTGFRRRGVSKRLAWPVTDYTRGRPKWVA